MNRLVVQEYGRRLVLADAASMCDISEENMNGLLEQASARISDQVGVREAFDVRAGALRVVDVAGIIRLSPTIELEVVPKFLDPSAPQRDFLAFVGMGRWGRVLSRDRISMGVGDRGDLASLVAIAMVDMYWQNHRRPLRLYRRRRFEDFVIEGDVDEESVLLPSADGFCQEVVELTRDNAYSATIRQAFRLLAAEVTDGNLRQEIVRVLQALGPQTYEVNRRICPLPSRHARWQDLHDLAVQVILGLGVDYSEVSRFVGPGFIVRTAAAWEELVRLALEAGLPELSAVYHRAWPLGERWQGGPTMTEPDVTISAQDGTVIGLADAKYKAAMDGRRLRVSSQDVYESLAFLEAAAVDTIVLVYPPSSAHALDRGAVASFDCVTVGTRTIVGVMASPEGLGERNGFLGFASRLGDAVRPLLGTGGDSQT